MLSVLESEDTACGWLMICSRNRLRLAMLRRLQPTAEPRGLTVPTTWASPVQRMAILAIAVTSIPTSAIVPSAHVDVPLDYSKYLVRDVGQRRS